MSYTFTREKRLAAVSAEGTTVYVGGVFEAFIPNEDPEPTATPTTSPTPTATPPAGNSPTTPVLDDFNRADGAIGSGWSGTTGAYTLSGNELRSSGAGVIFWGGESFGANQEAYYTVGSLETNTRIRLVLKSQSNTNYANGLLFVDYHTSAGSVKVMTFTTEQSYVQRGSTVYTTFAAGDRLWAKADSSGQVSVYKNGDLLTTVDVTGWPYYANGGYIGIWTSNVMTGTTFDDFGGGTLPTAFRLGQALAALWNDFTGWLEETFQARPVQASARAAISAPPVGEVWKNYVFAGSARIAVRTFENGSTTGTVTFLIADHLDSLSAIADADGNLVGQMRYTAFGEVRLGSIHATDYTYTGQLSQMDEIGLLFFRSRWMDPATAAFTTADTLVPDPYNPMDWNRYLYGRNNPINYNDPTGHWPEWNNVYDWVQGAIYQFTNDMSMGAVDMVATSYGVCMDCNESDAYRQGQQGGRVASTVVGTVEEVVGTYVAVTCAAMIPPTLGGGAVCTGLTVGVCALPTGGALAVEAGMVAGGGVAAVHGIGVVAFAKNNPIQGNVAKWKVGDPINSPTQNGYPSWSTAQRRYWQNRAVNAAPGEFSPENIARMQNGGPPQQYGVSMELHHINGRGGSDPHNINNLQEVWPWQHDTIDPYRHYRGPMPE